MNNTPALLWLVDKNQPIDESIKLAMTRFTQRPELAGRAPQAIQFPLGATPAQLPLINLTIEEAAHVPAGCFKLC